MLNISVKFFIIESSLNWFMLFKTTNIRDSLEFYSFVNFASMFQIHTDYSANKLQIFNIF